MGYNGAPSGLPHCNEQTCGPDTPCDRTIHAEANAIAFAARQGIETFGGTIYTTHSPCIDCAKLMINAGVSRIVYWEKFRDPAPINLLMSVGIGCEQF